MRRRVIIGLSVLIATVASIAVLPLALLTLGRPRRLYAWCATRLARALLALWGVQVVMPPRDAWPRGQVVYISNHSSTLDLFVLVALGLPNTRFFLRSFVQKFPPVAVFSRLMGTFFTVSQARPQERVRIFQRASRVLRRTGESVYLSPEGGRILGGRIGPFNKGAFHLAVSIGAPIQPFIIEIPPAIDPGVGFHIMPGVVRVHIKPLIDTGTWTVEHVERHRDDVRKLFVQWRGFRSLIDVVRDRAAETPDDLALAFLGNGEEIESSWTWRDLEARSAAIAERLVPHAQPGDRALLLLPPGLEFVAAFLGCLRAGVIAVPAPVPHGRRATSSLARLDTIARDAAPAVVISSVGRTAVGRTELPSALQHAVWIEAAGQTEALERTAMRSPLPDTIAFLQYTSGSTAEPRGVMVTHGNLASNLAYGAALGGPDAQGPSVSWLPPTHDMGLIEGILQPIWSGTPAYLMSPAAFLQRPARWLNAISRLRAVRSGGPNFAYELCARKVRATELADLDLSCWSAAFSGAEPVRAETMTRFASSFAPAGFQAAAFRPCYGLAEATLVVSSGRWDGTPTGRVSCGRARDETTAVVVDPDTNRVVEDGGIGEIWVQGPGIARGYWNKPELSAHAFAASTPDRPGAFLRTGDLGCLVDGQIVITGRLKDLLIVRGHKHFPQDLEVTAEESSSAIRPGSAVAVASSSDADGDGITIVIEPHPRRAADAAACEAAVDSVRRAIAELHGVQLAGVLVVPPGTVPRTTSGKRQRQACRELVLSDSLPVIAGWGHIAAIERAS